MRIPRCLDNLLTDGGQVASPRRRPRSTPQEHYLYASGTRFCWRLIILQGLVRPEGLGTLEKFTSWDLEPATFRFYHSALITTPPHTHIYSKCAPLKSKRVT
jgi:hypothetical protein